MKAHCPPKVAPFVLPILLMFSTFILTPPSKFGGSPTLIIRSLEFGPPILVARSSHFRPSSLIAGLIESRPLILIPRSSKFEPLIVVIRSSHLVPLSLVTRLVEPKPRILITRSSKFESPILNAKSLESRFSCEHELKDDRWITCNLHLSWHYCFCYCNVSTLQRSAHAFIIKKLILYATLQIKLVATRV